MKEFEILSLSAGAIPDGPISLKRLHGLQMQKPLMTLASLVKTHNGSGVGHEKSISVREGEVCSTVIDGVLQGYI